MAGSAPHPTLSLILDIIDILFKVAAVVIGGSWTWWNYRKSRIYAQKLELQVVGTVFTRDETLYGDIRVAVKNIGATKHEVRHAGSFCELLVVYDDLTEKSMDLFRVFDQDHRIEPGEAMTDTLHWRIPQPFEDIVWIKLNLRVVSYGVEWLSTSLVRVGSKLQTASSEVI